MDEKFTQAIGEEIALYGKLKELKNSPNFKDYLDFLTASAATIMINTFVGPKVPTQEEFLAKWGEVRGKLHVLQEVGGADLVEKQLLDQLKAYRTEA